LKTPRSHSPNSRRVDIRASRPKTVFHPERFTLENGLTVLLAENPTLPAVSLSLNVRSGARAEPEDKAGTAVLLARLLDEGTASRSSLEIAEAIESVGGSIDCDCSHESVSAFLGVLSKDLDLGLGLLADIAMHPLLGEEALEKERDRVLAEIRSAMDRPQSVAGWEFDELVYRDHPLHRPVHGYPKTIETITSGDLREFHKRHFHPNNALLSAVGDFKTPEILAQLESVFGGWEPGEIDNSPRSTLERQRDVRRKFLKVESEQAHIYFGHLGVERMHPDFYALQVLDTILGGGAGLTARIPRKLRDEQGLAYTTFASITSSAGLDPGKFLAYMGTSPANIGRAIDGFKTEIQTVVAEGVTAEELDDARAYLTGSFVFAFESNSQIARFLLNAEVFGLGFDHIDKYPGYIEAVTQEDLARVAAQHLSTEHYSLVISSREDMDGFE
jgi:zinc protease